MPRPTLAQLAYGSATVILSTLAILLLSQAGSVIAVAIACLVGLALGTLVAVTTPAPKRTPAAKRPLGTVLTVRGSGAQTGARVREHSLRR